MPYTISVSIKDSKGKYFKGEIKSKSKKRDNWMEKLKKLTPGLDYKSLVEFDYQVIQNK